MVNSIKTKILRKRNKSITINIIIRNIYSYYKNHSIKKMMHKLFPVKQTCKIEILDDENSILKNMKILRLD